jgi:hypothetical protein
MGTPATVRKLTYQTWLEDNQHDIIYALETACLNWLNQQAKAIGHDGVERLEISDKWIPLLVDEKKSKSNAAYKFSKPNTFLFVVTVHSFSSGKSTFNTGSLLKEYWNHGSPEIKKPTFSNKIIVKVYQKTPEQIAREKELAYRCLQMDLGLFNAIRTTGVSQYLIRKQITDTTNARDLRFAKDFIALLIKDLDGNIRGIQRIYDNANKLYTKGFKKEASFIEITGKHQTVICEGFATGMSIHLATGYRVLCGLDAGNLINVGSALKERGEVAIIAADNDVRKPTDKCQINTGMVAAMETAKKTGFSMVYPELNGLKVDFNDLHIAHGLNAVKSVFFGN